MDEHRLSTGAAPFVRADASSYPRARTRRSHSALALMVGLHLLAAWFWLQQRPMHRPRSADTPGMVTILLRPIDAVRAHASPSTPQRPRSTPAVGHPGARAPAVRQSDLPPVYVPPRAPTSDALPGAAPATPAAPITSPVSQDSPAGADSPAPATADGNFTTSLSRRQAGRIDREPRGGKSGVPTEADTPWARFQRGLEAAHVDRPMSAHLDSYTSPDGVVIYRRRVGGRTACYRSGSVAGGVDSSLGALGNRNANDAGSIACPASAQWQQEE